jgi:hypothetical protein
MGLKWTISIYVTWWALHYVAAHAYTYFCVPMTWKGILLSPFIVPTVHCTSLRWLIYTGGNKMLSLWLLCGTYVLENIKIKHEGRFG